MAEIGEAGDAKARVLDPAGHDSVEMRKLRLDIDRDAVERHPALEPHANSRDLVFEAFALVRPFHPDADAILAPLAAHVEGCERSDDPFLEPGHIGPHVGAALLEVEHRIGHPLAGTVIGDLPAASGIEYREAGFEQVSGLAAGAGGVERGVFQEPDQFARPAFRDIGGAGLHGSQGLGVGNRGSRYQPLYRPAAERARERRQIKALADINHWLTITW